MVNVRNVPIKRNFELIIDQFKVIKVIAIQNYDGNISLNCLNIIYGFGSLAILT